MDWNHLLSKGHFYESEEEGFSRENDYDIIIRSTLFRRLQDKAQVFPLEEDDYVRTRLTHSMEVSAIGKRLGEITFEKLRAREADPWFEASSEKEFSDVLLCAGLIHDIGNPPFGHFGEFTIREWFQDHLKDLELEGRPVTERLAPEMLSDLYFFEGNAQSLRVLSKTPHLGEMAGFNLSYSVLASIIKYPVSSYDLAQGQARGYRKFGFNLAEKELFSAISHETGIGASRHPLSYLLEAADDIAYRTSDLEDAMVKRVVTLPEILTALRDEPDRQVTRWEGGEQAARAALQQQADGMICRLEEIYNEELAHKVHKPELTAVQRWNQYMQEQMIKDAAEAFAEHYEALMQGEFRGDLFDQTPSGYIIEKLSKFSEKAIYTSSVKIKAELFGRRILNTLFSHFMPAVIKYDTGVKMTYIECRIIDTLSSFYKIMYHAQAAGKGESEKLYLRILMLTDYISGMTDNYAKRLYRELFS